MAKEKVIQMIAHESSMYGLTNTGAIVILAAIGWTPFAGCDVHVNEVIVESKKEKVTTKYSKLENNAVEIIGNDVEKIKESDKKDQPAEDTEGEVEDSPVIIQE